MTFTYSEIDNRVFDVIINNTFKVQDKVITEFKKQKSSGNGFRDYLSYCVRLERNSTKISKTSYKLGDNDMYWLHLPDKSGAYIIPENILLENQLISHLNIEQPGCCLLLYPYNTDVSLHKTGWLNDYLYFYKNESNMIKI